LFLLAEPKRRLERLSFSMKPHVPALLLLVGCCGLIGHAADQPPPADQPVAPGATSPSMRDVIRAHITAEENKAKSGAPASKAIVEPPLLRPEKDELPPPAATTPTAKTTPGDGKNVAAEPATVLPKVEVNRGKITVLDVQLAKQEQEIAREKKNTKPTELDKALNDSKVAHPLAIFGGDSSQFRQHVASERVKLMEDEKDLLEAIAHAKTKAEKEALQKQLDELRAYRRELDQSLR
jgi:hypothetical protein